MYGIFCFLPIKKKKLKEKKGLVYFFSLKLTHAH